MERLAIDLLAPELYGGDPYPTYAWMRANEPIYWDEVNELWGISRYDDIVEIAKRKDVIPTLRWRGECRPSRSRPRRGRVSRGTWVPPYRPY